MGHPMWLVWGPCSAYYVWSYPRYPRLQCYPFNIRLWTTRKSLGKENFFHTWYIFILLCLEGARLWPPTIRRSLCLLVWNTETRCRLDLSKPRGNWLQSIVFSSMMLKGIFLIPDAKNNYFVSLWNMEKKKRLGWGEILA